MLYTMLPPCDQESTHHAAHITACDVTHADKQTEKWEGLAKTYGMATKDRQISQFWRHMYSLICDTDEFISWL